MKHQNTLNIVDRTEHSWQQQLSGARRSFAELCTFLDLAEDSFDGVMKLEKQFPIIAPDPYLSRIVKGDPRDPLLLQVLPQAAELISTPGYSDDPLEEANASPVQGLIHKYHGRVLLVASAACAIHCRYCFRRHFPYQENRLQRNPAQSGARNPTPTSTEIFTAASPHTIAINILISKEGCTSGKIDTNGRIVPDSVGVDFPACATLL